MRKRPGREYVEGLEARVRTLEGVIQQIVAGTLDPKSVDLQSLATATPSPHASGPTPTSAVTNTSEDASGALDDLRDDLSELSLEYEAWDRRYVGSSSGISLAKSILPMEDMDRLGAKPEQSHIENMIALEHTDKEPAPLPPYDLAVKLVKAFFDHVNSILPVIHRPSFQRDLENDVASTDPSFRGLLFAIYALGARSVDDPRIPTFTGGEIHMFAHSMATKLSKYSAGAVYAQTAARANHDFLTGCKLYDLQRHALIVLYLSTAVSPPTFWLMCGWGLRGAIDVGAHREKRKRWSDSPLEDQLRKRAMWLMLYFDRSIASGLGRPVVCDADEVDLALPLDIDDDALDAWQARGASPPPSPSGKATPVAGFNAMVSLSSIMAKALKTVYHPHRSAQDVRKGIIEIDSAMNDWLNKLPSHLRWDPNNVDSPWFAQSCSVFANFWATQILAHRALILPNKSGALAASPSLAICYNAARACLSAFELLKTKTTRFQDFVWHITPNTGAVTLILMIRLTNSSNETASSLWLQDIRNALTIFREASTVCFHAEHILVKMEKLEAAIASGTLHQVLCAPCGMREPDGPVAPSSAMSNSLAPMTALANSSASVAPPTSLPSVFDSSWPSTMASPWAPQGLAPQPPSPMSQMLSNTTSSAQTAGLPFPASLSPPSALPNVAAPVAGLHPNLFAQSETSASALFEPSLYANLDLSVPSNDFGTSRVFPRCIGADLRPRQAG